MVFIIHNTLTTAESFSGLLHLSTTSMRELHTIAHRSLSVAYASTFQQNAHMHEESCIKKNLPTHTLIQTHLHLHIPAPAHTETFDLHEHG